MRTLIKAFVVIGVLVASFAWVKRDDYRRNKSIRGIYKLDLQTYESVDHPTDWRKMPTEQFFRWRLDIPRKFIHAYSGRNGVPRYDPNRRGRNTVRVTLFTVIDKETMTIVPDPNVRTGFPVPNSMDIYINNGHSAAGRSLDEASGQLCLTMEEVGKLRNSPTYKCIEGKRKCKLALSVDGWPVRISLVRELYMEDPQKYCGMAKDFLDGFTLERDDMRIANYKSIDGKRPRAIRRDQE